MGLEYVGFDYSSAVLPHSLFFFFFVLVAFLQFIPLLYERGKHTCKC